MSERKNTGSYYTPGYLASFIVQYLLPEVARPGQPITFLEPSAGDGVFIAALLQAVPTAAPRVTLRIRTVERDAAESAKIEQVLAATEEAVPHDCLVGDFLQVQQQLQPGYDFICGNPPYLNKKRLTKEQIAICASINEQAAIPAFVSNIWTAFVLRSAQLLSDAGVMAFVLPAEILQVKYAAAVKQYLYQHFERIEFFDFKELLFDAKGQGTILFIGYKKTTRPSGIYFTNISSTEELSSQQFIFKTKPDTALLEFKIKESHHDLPADDITLLYKVRQQVRELQHYATSKPGVVTAANSFFIVNEERLDQFNLRQFSKPIIQKGAFVNGKVEFTMDDFHCLSQAGYPAYLLDFNGQPDPEDKVLTYLAQGELAQIDQRYKCQQRTRWYDIPNVAGPGEALFFKRCHHYPKLLKNTASVLATDSAYKVSVLPGYTLDSLVFSFYNSLTLAFAELEGRYYGGGVLELTPSEFKKLPLVYTERTTKQFAAYAERFKCKANIGEVLDVNDQDILYSIPGMTSQVVAAIQRIRRQLVEKRFRT